MLVNQVKSLIYPFCTTTLEMEGIVFTELLEMIEEMWGIAFLDRIVDRDLPSGGIYTVGGNYQNSELNQLVQRTHVVTGTPVRQIYLMLGRRMSNVFTRLDREVFDECDSAFDFMEGLQNYVSDFVHRIHPDAVAPQFIAQRLDASRMTVTYRSERKLGDYTEGILQGLLDHYAEKAQIRGENISETGEEVLFTIQKIA